MSVEEKLTEILKSRNAGAFLFVGSGFSRRYLGLEDWRGLLSRFSVAGQPFGYYLATANGDLPAAANLLAIDFNEYWWRAPEYKASVERYGAKVDSNSYALRLEICAYLAKLGVKPASSEYAEEIALLASLNVDGIITTNWDLFIEQLFPDYKTYIGQNELLFANPQEIGEVYKIHGCSSKPESLVLTAEDYSAFNDRNPYLAAKLIAVFVEHPVVFIGYSISDANVSSLLTAISRCVGKDQVEHLRRNLIFVQRPQAGEEPGISDTYLSIDGTQIPLVLVRTNDFADVYRALGAVKRKIPARVLRYCKEQLYELVRSLEPEKKLCVVDIDAIDRKEDVEFLVGVGVASQHLQLPELSNVGYEAIEVKDLIHDLIHDDREYDPRKIVDNVIARAGRNTQNVPVFKYLRALGIDSAKSYEDSGLKLDKWVRRELADFKVKQYTKPFFARRHQSLKEIIEECTPETAATLLPFLPKEKLDLDVLKQFLIEHEEKMLQGNYASYFKKAACIYDHVKWGWGQ